jgi:Ca2+-binding RTX toxin-like protein
MIGGDGNDTFFWNEGDGSDLISGGNGIDTVQFSGASQGIEKISLSFSNDLFLTRTDTAVVPSLNTITLQMSSIESIFMAGVEGNEQFIVGNLNGSGLQNITISAGSGNDLLDGRTSLVKFAANGDLGNDILLGGSASDQLIGGFGNDALFGSSGNDTLTGISDGDFTTTPGRGEQDVLLGGNGADIFVLGDRKGVNNSARFYYNDGDNAFDGGNNIFTGMDGVSDFARIVDFRFGEDKIRLAGSPSEYVLRPVSGSLGGGSAIAGDVGIFKTRSFFLNPDELIAVVNDTGVFMNSLNNTNQFQFV